MATINGTEYRIGKLTKTCRQYGFGFRYVSYEKSGENIKYGKLFRSMKEVNGFKKEHPEYNEPKGLYEELKAIQKLLWKDDDIIEYETIAEIYNRLCKLQIPTNERMACSIRVLKEAFEDDCLGQEELFEAQDLMANLVLDVAYEEHKQDKLTKDFPWLYHRK